MPFPGATTFPGHAQFPGVSGRLIFTTPTQEVYFRLAGRGLIGSYAQGLTVFRVDGQWRTQLSPTAETLGAADRFYGGGRIHPLTPDLAAELTAAGFGDHITEETT